MFMTTVEQYENLWEFLSVFECKKVVWVSGRAKMLIKFLTKNKTKNTKSSNILLKIKAWNIFSPSLYFLYSVTAVISTRCDSI